MKLLGSHFSPFVRKVMVYAQERGIPLELEMARANAGFEAFDRASPFGKMPAFVDGDFAIADSTAIITYLNATFLDDALIPAQPAEKARVIWFEEFADTMLAPLVFAIFGNRIVKARLMKVASDEAAATAAIEKDLPPYCDYLESVLDASGYLVGGRFSLADIAVAVMFVNFAHAGVTVDPARWPKLAAYITAIHARDSVAAWIAKDQAMLARLTN